MSQDRNQQLTRCQGIRERKQVISGQNVTGQESTTYNLSRHQRKKTGDQWTECHWTGINNLQPVKASEKENRGSVDRMSQDRNQQLTTCQGIRERKQGISGQNVTGQESTTYSLSRHKRKKTGDQWTECHRTGINNLQPVKGSEKENR